jgi:hypothetical protein
MTYETADVAIGAVTITVDDQRQITYSSDEVEPDANGNIVFTLQSTGPDKIWNFKQNDPINIANPSNFTTTSVSATSLTINDTSADKATNPTHNYTIKIENQDGEELAFDPIIKDRT